ncbi:MAG TPA: hypothetical protein DCQ98_05740 [Planctomycetaceae bacterium]|nr:hypothetical protein [Planctomycetaceae bacterium]HRF02222.1 hypothetical protein [Pirellulaceae bacterium]
MSQLPRYPHPGFQPPQSTGMHPVLKTCLFVVLGLMTIGIVLGIVITIFVIMLAGSKVDQVRKNIAQGTPQKTQPANGRTGGASTPARIDPATIPKPKKIDDALALLARNEAPYHEVAADWLNSQPVDTARMTEVSASLVARFDSSGTPTHNKILAALEKWAAAAHAIDLAAKLGPNRPNNPRILAIIKRLKEPQAAMSVAPLLESDSDALLAKETLVALGPQVAPFVAPLLDSDKGLARSHAETILQNLGIDPVEARFDAAITQLQDKDPFNDERATENLLAAEVTADRQGRVEPMLLAKLGEKNRLDADKLAPLLDHWWSDAYLSDLQRNLSEIGGMDRRLYDLLADHATDETIRALTAALKDNWHQRDQVTDCLIRIGERATPEVLKITGVDDNVRKQIDRFLAEVNVDSAKILERHLETLRRGTEDDVEAAFAFFDGKSPASLELTPEQHDEVAVAMSAGLKKVGVFEREKAHKVFLEWVTPAAAAGLVTLVREARFGEDWEEPFRKLIEMDVPEIAAPLCEEVLTDRQKGEKAGQIMRRAGPAVQRTALEVLKTISEPIAAQEMVIVLQMNADATAIPPLEELLETAEQRRLTPLVNLCKEALRQIRRRAKAEEEAAGGNGEGDG